MKDDKLWMGLIGGLLGLILFGGAIELVFGEPSQSLIELVRTLAFVGLLYGPVYAAVQKKVGPTYGRSFLAALPVLGVAAVILIVGGHRPESIAVSVATMVLFAFLQSTCAYLLDRHTART